MEEGKGHGGIGNGIGKENYNLPKCVHDRPPRMGHLAGGWGGFV